MISSIITKRAGRSTGRIATNVITNYGFRPLSSVSIPATSTTRMTISKTNRTMGHIQSSSIRMMSSLPFRTLPNQPYNPLLLSCRYNSTLVDESSTNESSTPGAQDKKRFDEMEGMHPIFLDNLKRMGLIYMTDIQEETYAATKMNSSASVENGGVDVLGRARTGTGKTVAFLLPALHTLLQSPNPGTILILSPTRELTIQIAEAAKALTRRCEDMRVETLYGGTSKHTDIKRLEKGGSIASFPSIIVATPGRLLDHLENTTLYHSHHQNRDGRSSMQPPLTFKQILKTRTKVVVLDETDRLLDMGFRNDIQKVLRNVPPKQERQMLLFSATLPNDLQQIMRETMKPDYVTVDCRGSEGDNGETPAIHQIQQHHVVLSKSSLLTGSLQILHHTLESTPNAKIVAFFPTARLVSLYHALLSSTPLFSKSKTPLIEIHSRLSQPARTKNANRFRPLQRGVLLTSDVSARGVDYPDVSHVIQFGIPADRETYIHRLGRTGRAGKKGEGILILSPMEEEFLSELNDISIPRHEALTELLNDEDAKTAMNTALQPVRTRIAAEDEHQSSYHDDNKKSLLSILSKAHQAMIGFYKGILPKLGRTNRNLDEMMEFINAFSMQCGVSTPPALDERLVQKLGLGRIKGIRTKKRTFVERGGRGGGRGGSGGRGGGRGGGGRGRDRNQQDRGFDNHGGSGWNNRQRHESDNSGRQQRWNGR